MKPLEAAVDALAVHRLARLVTADTITQPARAEIILHAYLAGASLKYPRWRRPRTGLSPRDRPMYDELVRMSDAQLDDLPEVDDDAPMLAGFIRCRWCVGLWISGFVVVARRYCPRVWDPCARALALSSVGALLAGLER